MAIRLRQQRSNNRQTVAIQTVVLTVNGLRALGWATELLPKNSQPGVSAMTRTVVKAGCEFDALREARPAISRRFRAGAVLNVLQWVNPAMARFTVEGEGIEVRRWSGASSPYVSRSRAGTRRWRSWRAC